MEISDRNISEEIESYKTLIEHAKMVNAPKPIIERHYFWLEILEELLRWRTSGRVWLERLTEEEKAINKAKGSFPCQESTANSKTH